MTHQPNERLLEVGCGDGDFLVSAEAENWQVTGIEYSADACGKANQRLKNGKVFCGELQSAHLETEQLDLCVISDVVERDHRLDQIEERSD